jgi:hypothetical protein
VPRDVLDEAKRLPVVHGRRTVHIRGYDQHGEPARRRSSWSRRTGGLEWVRPTGDKLAQPTLVGRVGADGRLLPLPPLKTKMRPQSKTACGCLSGRTILRMSTNAILLSSFQSPLALLGGEFLDLSPNIDISHRRRRIHRPPGRRR